MINYDELFTRVRGTHKIPKDTLCLDPGETTGWALFHFQHLVRCGQIETVKDGEIQWGNLHHLFWETLPAFVVCEDYRIYAHKLARHTFSPVITLRLIGGIELTCYQNNWPIVYQMATTAKGFVTDEKLKEWGFWQENMRHSRDAIRHGIYFLLFHNKGEDII
jgi:hypothetical protein